MSMHNRQLATFPVCLPNQVPAALPTPKFHLGQSVYWAYVPSQDFGFVIGIVYAAEASTQALGYHYAVQLDPNSPSFADGIYSDWAFEEDIEPIPALARIAHPSTEQK